jgi:hypothetical protein
MPHNHTLPHTEVAVASFPDCDFCKPASVPAAYDARGPMGQWAFMCQSHYTQHGRGLGLGRGQRLVLAQPIEEMLIPLSTQAILDHKEKLQDSLHSYEDRYGVSPLDMEDYL